MKIKITSEIEKLSLPFVNLTLRLLQVLFPFTYTCRILVVDTLLLNHMINLLLESRHSKRLSPYCVRHGSHQGGSPQNELGDEQTCRMTLASVYVLRCLSTTWSQLQMMGRSPRWEWVLIGVSPLNTRDQVQ